KREWSRGVRLWGPNPAIASAVCVEGRTGAETCSKIRGDSALALPPLDELSERLFRDWFHRRLLVAGKQALVEPVRGVIGIGPAGLGPALVVAPVRDHRRIEGVAVARHGMARAEGMPTRAHLPPGGQRQVLLLPHHPGPE